MGVAEITLVLDRISSELRVETLESFLGWKVYCSICSKYSLPFPTGYISTKCAPSTSVPEGVIVPDSLS